MAVPIYHTGMQRTCASLFTPHPSCQERVNAAKAEAAADRADRGTSGGLSASRSLRMRYYDEEPTSIEKKNKPYAHLQSGQISEQLAEALGVCTGTDLGAALLGADYFVCLGGGGVAAEGHASACMGPLSNRTTITRGALRHACMQT